MTVTEHWQQSVTENGETHSTSFSVEVSLAGRSAAADGNGHPVRRLGRTAGGLRAGRKPGGGVDIPSAADPVGAGGERGRGRGVKRTVYDLAPEGGPLMHTAWFLDEAGLGPSGFPYHRSAG